MTHFGLCYCVSDTECQVLVCRLCHLHGVSCLDLCSCVLIQSVPSVDLSSCVFLIQGVKCLFVGLWSCVSLTLNVKCWSELLCLLH